MTTKTEANTVEELEKKVAAGEVAELEQQRLVAKSAEAKATARLSEIEERRTKIATAVVAGDEGARQEVAGLDDKHDHQVRQQRTARAALPQLEEAIAEAKERHRHAQDALHEHHYGELARQGKGIDARAEELAKELIEVLEQRASHFHKMVAALYKFDPEAAGSANHAGVEKRWLREKFGRWL